MEDLQTASNSIETCIVSDEHKSTKDYNKTVNKRGNIPYPEHPSPQNQTYCP